jgi:hypothetical protein
MTSDTKKSTIIFVSNRFGYGPTVTLLHLVRLFVKNVNAEIVFIGSGICKEAFDASLNGFVTFIDADERDYEAIKKIIGRYDHDNRVFLVSCLNRFAIQAANDLGVPNAIIDFLTWMWNGIPKGYEDAGYYFSNHFGTSNRKEGMIEVPLILGPMVDKVKAKKDYLLINIGGTQNHLMPGIPKNYLALLSFFLNSIRIPTGLSVVVAGGKQAIEFLKCSSTRPEFRIESLSHDEYVSIQQRSAKIVSLAGTNSTFMSFALDIPVVFLLPQLYAHWKLTLFLKERGYISDCYHWDRYMSVPSDISQMTELDSIYMIEELAKEALSDHGILSKMKEDLQHLIDENTDISGQKRFIKDIGIGGEEVILRKLKEFWNL